MYELRREALRPSIPSVIMKPKTKLSAEEVQFNRYRDRLHRILEPIPCSHRGCSESLLAAKCMDLHFKAKHHVAGDIKTNPARACVWCDGDVTWNRGRKKMNTLHLLLCFNRYYEMHRQSVLPLASSLTATKHVSKGSHRDTEDDTLNTHTQQQRVWSSPELAATEEMVDTDSSYLAEEDDDGNFESYLFSDSPSSTFTYPPQWFVYDDEKKNDPYSQYMETVKGCRVGLPCPVCSEIFKPASEIPQHFKEVHQTKGETQGVWSCCWCSLKVESWDPGPEQKILHYLYCFKALLDSEMKRRLSWLQEAGPRLNVSTQVLETLPPALSVIEKKWRPVAITSDPPKYGDGTYLSLSDGRRLLLREKDKMDH